MVKPADDTPDKLRPYIFHSVNLQWGKGKEATGDCPFCGREKFGVTLETGQFRCLVCNEGTDNGKAIKGGNAVSFVRILLEKSIEATPISAYKELAAERGLLYPDTLIAWELGLSIMTRDWLAPGYNAEAKVANVYRYISMNQKKRLILTPTLGHKLHGMNLFDRSKPHLYVCEGLWDAMALWEALGSAKLGDNGLVPTASKEAALLSQVNVIGIPGCEVFNESWLPLFADKIVYLMFDNDHERTHPNTGAPIPPGALEGMKRLAGVLSAAKQPPSELYFIRWGTEERPWNPDLPHGFDVRDALSR